MDKKTPLYDTHVKYGGKIVPFGGFLLPIQYETGIKQEHMAVRTALMISLTSKLVRQDTAQCATSTAEL